MTETTEPTAPAAEPKSNKNRNVWLVIGGVVAGALVVGSIGAASKEDATSARPTPPPMIETDDDSEDFAPSGADDLEAWALAYGPEMIDHTEDMAEQLTEVGELATAGDMSATIDACADLETIGRQMRRLDAYTALNAPDDFVSMVDHVISAAQACQDFDFDGSVEYMEMVTVESNRLAEDIGDVLPG